MSNSYRIRTEVGKDKYVNVLLEQDFEQLEILSLKILQSQIYTRLCSDYGVIAGRITANSGFGLPNCKVSIFVPLTNEDLNNPIISDLYPYRSLSDTNEDGYRYNLLPYVKSHSGHNPTGSFPDRIDVLTDPNLIEVYDKYYKFTVKTNDSGDFMIFGVPLGTQTIHIDIDLSDIGEFSLSPQDLIRTGVATEAQVAGTEFRNSTDLNTLPQIISLNRTINIEPLWGQPDVCTIGITRTDFDITEEAGINITPTAIFMGSIFSNGNDQYQTQLCRPKIRSGELCNLIAGPGQILAIRQTIFNDDTGRPVLETFELDAGGQVIDDNGAWLVDVPMNLDYVTTNEFGDRVISNDPKVGIPTRGKYRFKVKWNQSPTLSEDIKRGYFLVPNIREYGWQQTNKDPLVIQDWVTSLFPPVVDPDFFIYNELAKKSYSFSLDWNDYVDPQAAISCEDTFYLMSFNKVYTVSQLIDQYRRGFLPNEFVGIKNNLDEACESDNVKFPNNDANYRFDLLYLLALISMYIFKPILFGLVPIIHILVVLLFFLGIIFSIIVTVVLIIVLPICYIIAGIVDFLNLLGAGLQPVDCIDPDEIAQIAEDIANLYKSLLNINLPLLVYPNCELCSCSPGGQIETSPSSSPVTASAAAAATEIGGNSLISTYMLATQYDVKDVDVQYRSGIQSLLAGKSFTRDEPSGQARVPQYSLFGTDTDCNNYCGNGEGNNPDPCPKVLFTNNITLAERINLFNVKAKYFDENSSTNPGGGVNRIKVTFNTPLNPTAYHLDNMLVISCREGSLSNFTPGQLITFQDPGQSSDININGYTDLNQYGTGAVTGTTYRSGTSVSVNVEWANPNPSVPISQLKQTTPYLLTLTGDPQYHKFPMDIEYYQVITAMTYNTFSAQCVFDTISLNNRFLGNDTDLREVNLPYSYTYYPPNGSYPPRRTYSPLSLYKKHQEQVLVFLVRGVDPYSTRQPCSYDLSRLFGYPLNSWGNKVVSGNYKLNIPIQPSNSNSNQNALRSVRHSYGLTGTPLSNILTNTDTTTGIRLYYDTYHFQLSTSGLAKFSGFTSVMPSYYSSLDSSQLGSNINTSFRPSDAPNDVYLRRFADSPNNNSGTVLRVKSPGNTTIFQNGVFWQNSALPMGGSGPYYWGFSVEIDVKLGAFFIDNALSSCQRDYFGAVPNSYPDDSRGYYVNEIVDGGSLMGQVKSKITNFGRLFQADGWYFAPRYKNTYNFQAATTPTNARKIVMRSDRLPTSSVVVDAQGNSFALQNNLLFSIYKLSDEGLAQGTTGTPSFIGGSADPNALSLLSAETINNPVIESFSCDGAVPLFCYSGTATEIGIYPSNNICYTNGVTGKKIMKNGCYQLITEPLLSLPVDFLIISEWTSRLLVNFGACRNVWSHLFVNNWINGSLYAFAFKNDRIFDANNRPSSFYCRRTLYLHPTNNFYYRSSPYITGSTTGFVGALPTTFLGIPFGGNDRNLKFPTTMLDLGPRSQYLQELVFSDEFDGYVVNRLTDSSYSDVSEILNYLIISRLTNLSFVNLLTSLAGANIFEFFLNDRQVLKNLVDADYAQMISISSELGISPFEAINYPTDPNGQDPLYINTRLKLDVVFGIFWKSNQQLRDYISPKRNIISNTANLGSICSFSDIPVFSQEVPFYQWEIKTNPDQDSIFGSQGNDWYTFPVDSPLFFSSKYQSMDRLNSDSRYFRYNTTGGTGYIYATDPNDGDEDANVIRWTRNNPNRDVVTIGAPFHFYFGLKKGKTAFDKFAKKWIKFDTITD